MTKPKLTYIWHMYHNQLVTAIFFPAPIKNRRITIKERKPPHEHALRLRLLKKVKGKVSDKITTLVMQYYRNGRRYDLTDNKEFLALHKKECKNCPWDGVAIFTEVEPNTFVGGLFRNDKANNTSQT